MEGPHGIDRISQPSPHHQLECVCLRVYINYRTSSVEAVPLFEASVYSKQEITNRNLYGRNVQGAFIKKYGMRSGDSIELNKFIYRGKGHT